MARAIRWLWIVVVSMVTLLAVSACASGAAVSSPTASKANTPAPTAAAKAAAPTATVASAKPQVTSTQASAPTQLVTVKWAAPASLHSLATYVALEKGYFKEQGINVEVVPIQTLSDQMPVLAKGDLDVATGGLAPSLINVVARGVPVKVISDSGNPYPGFSYMGLTIRKDLIDEGKVKTVADLKGRKIAVASQQTMSAFFGPLMAQAGLSINDLEFVTLSLPDTIGAFTTKSIDGAYQLEPQLSQTLSMGLVSFFKPVADVRPGTMGAFIVASPQFLQNKDVLNRWMLANLKGVRTYLDAVKTGKDVDQIIDIAVKDTSVKDRAIYQSMLKDKRMVGFDPNGGVNTQRMTEDIKLWTDLGYITEKVDLPSLLDMSFVENAVQKLGKQ